LAVAGIVAAGWFFIGYGHQDPRSAVSLELTENNVELKAAQILSELGFSIDNFETEVTFQANQQLLDSLQKQLGRKATINAVKKGVDNIKPFTWNVVFALSVSGQNTEGLSDEPTSKEIVVILDQKGRLIGLRNNTGILPDNRINRKALSAVFKPEADSASEVFANLSDSLLRRLMYFDLEQSQTEDTPLSDLANIVERQIKNGRPYQYDANDAQLLAEYYLGKTDWNINEFVNDTVTIERINSVNSAKVRFKTPSPSHKVSSALQQRVILEVKVTPTGALAGLNYRYNSGSVTDNQLFVWPVLRMIMFILLGIAGIIMFFFRIRAGAIDTRSALVVAVIMGLAVSLLIFLSTVNNLNPFDETTNWLDSFFILVWTGLGGAVSSLGFFMLFALGDSVTRQYMPEKLSCYDYLRQGMFFNKPLGSVVLQSLSLGFVLAGIWTLSIQLMPRLYIEIDDAFLNGTVAWPPIYVLAKTLTLSLIVTLGVYMVIGGQVIGWTQNKITAAGFTIVLGGVLFTAILPAGPIIEQFVVAFVLAGALTFIYFKWEMLTLFLSLFLFLGLLYSSPGWLIYNSPDGYLFISLLFLIAFLFVSGTIAIIKGKTGKMLPKYIPEYVNQLAHEERIRQELEIARNVQQSFLPVKMPDLDRLDISAVCKPAHETGGDYYDVIQLNEHQVAIAIGDVSGKGIPAAFYMTFTKGILHSLCRETISPSEILVKANRLFFENAERGTFISLIFGILDLEKKTFTFSRAGHNPIIKINRKTGKVEELQPGGIGIGLTKDITFQENIKEVALTLETDDILILYTDGIVEALNQVHDFYGTQKLIDSLQGHLHKNSSGILEKLIDSLTSFTGSVKQHDDMTVMVLRLDD